MSEELPSQNPEVPVDQFDKSQEVNQPAHQQPQEGQQYSAPTSQSTQVKEITAQTGGQKTVDFIIGFFVVSIITAIILVTFSFLFTTIGALFMGNSNSAISLSLELGIMILGTVANLSILLGVAIFFVKKGRKFITLGYITSIFILPLLIFGSCLALLSGAGY